MKQLFKNKNWKINKEYNIDKILYLLIDRPNEISYLKYFYWINKKEQIHRNYDLPAVYNSNSDVSYYKNGIIYK